MKSTKILIVFKKILAIFIGGIIFFIPFLYPDEAMAACEGVNYTAALNSTTGSVVRGGQFDLLVRVKKTGDITDPCYSADTKANLYFTNSSGQAVYYGTSPTIQFNGENGQTQFSINLNNLGQTFYANPSSLLIKASIWNDKSGGTAKETNPVVVNVTGSTNASGAFATTVEFWDDTGAAKSQFKKDDKIRVLLKVPASEQAKIDAVNVPANLYMVVKVNGNTVGTVTKPKADFKSNQWVDTTVTVAKGFKDGANSVMVELWGDGTNTKVSTAIANVQATGLGTTTGPGPTGPGPTGPGPTGPGPTEQDNTIVGKIESPIAIDSIGAFIVTVIQYLLGLVAALAVLFIVIGGVRMVASGGSEGSITAGKKTVTWAVIGLVVSVLAFTIVNIVQSLLKVNVQ